MRKPLIFSGIFHVLILALVLISFDLWGDPEIPPESPIVVAITPDMEIAPEAVTKPSEPKPPAPPEPEEKPQAEKAPEKQTETKNPEPQRVEEEQAETPPAPPVPAEADKPPPPETKQVTKDIPNVTQRDKPKPPTKFDPTKIAQLLNKTDNRAPPTPDKKPQKATDPDPSKASQQNQSPIQAQQAKANIASLIASQIRQCWTAPVGSTGAETLVVKIRIYLRVDGDLADPPVIVDRGRMMSDDLYRVAAEAAVRAVQRCAPLKRLPPEYYDYYKDLILNFDPSML